MFTGEGLQGLLQGAADLTLLGDANRMGQAVSSGDRRGTALNAGLLALGLTPYGPVVKAARRVIGKFTTSRGSTYEHFADGATQRFRSGKDHTDTSVGLQPPSNKTVFVNPKDADKVGGLFQNTDMATKLVPVTNKNGQVVRMRLVLTEKYGPRKVGEVLEDVSVSTKPAVGKHPVEIIQSISPKGDAGTAVHFGTKITSVKK